MAVEDAEGFVWSITNDVLRRATSASVRSGATYEIPHCGTASEEYVGEVGVDRRTFTQWADATTTFTLAWEGIDIRFVSTLRVDIGTETYDLVIDCDAFEGDGLVSHREWRDRSRAEAVERDRALMPATGVADFTYCGPSSSVFVYPPLGGARTR